MVIDWLFSLFFVVAFAFLLYEIFMMKKSEGRLNGISWLLLSLIVLLCYGTFIVGFVNIIRIPINIVSVGIIYFISAGALHYYNYRVKKSEKQKYFWNAIDVAFAVILFIITVMLVFNFYTPSLEMRFYNTDASVHFKNATQVFYKQHVYNMYFAPLQNALCMDLLSPILSTIDLYKVEIILEGAFLYLEVLLFWICIREFLSSKAHVAIGICITVLYTCGYPVNGWLFNFLYWGIGVMLIGSLMYILRCYRRGGIDKSVLIVYMMFICAALPVTYMLFGPFTYIALFITFFANCREGKLFSKTNVVLALRIFLLPCVLAIYYCYFDYLRVMDMDVSEIIGLSGGIFRELYISFIWVMPLVVYGIIKKIKNKQFDEGFIFTITYILVQLALFVGMYKGIVSVYYFYKFYYPLWFLCFYIALEAAVDLWKHSKEMLVSIGVIFAALFVFYFSGTEKKIISSDKGICDYERTSEFFSLYDFNLQTYRQSALRYPEQYKEITEFVLNELPGNCGDVPVLTDIDNYLYCYWYEGFTGFDCSAYYGWQNSFDDVVEHLNENNVKYFVVYKDSQTYAEHQKIFDSLEHVYDSDYGAVIRYN